MKINTLLLTSTLFAATLHTVTPVQAASVLIHRADGRIIPETIPKDACEFSFYIPGEGGLGSIQNAAFPMADGTEAVNTREWGGFFWKISTSAGPQLGPDGKTWYVRWHFEGKKEKDTWRRDENKDWTAISPLKTQESRVGTPEACVGYINTDGTRFFGNRLQDVDKLVFYTKDDGAHKVVEQKNKAESLRLDAWRKKISPGSDTHCGMAIETKAPLLKVQTSIGEKWFKLAQVYPKGEKQCVFKDGEYVE